MIRHILVAASAAVWAAGCTLIQTDTAVKPIVDSTTAEQQLISDLQADRLDQSRSLVLLSRGTYQCGDPEQKIRANSPVDARNKLDAQRVKEAMASLEVLKTYQKTLDAIVDRTKKKVDHDSKVFSDAQAAVGGLAAVVPVAAPYATAASSAIALMSAAVADINTKIANDQMIAYARGMKGVLDTAVDILRRNYQSLARSTGFAFLHWDDCARESLYYMRDVASTEGIIAQNGRRLPAYVAPSTGVELDTAWRTYRAKRSAYRARLLTQKTYDDQLDAVIKQNNDLASGKIDIADAASSLSDLATKAKKACQDFQAATNQKLGAEVCSKS
jgi:hypothetical protein